MTDYTVFTNAPITEALLDIQVDLSAETDVAKLAAIHDKIRDRFPIRKERSYLQFQLATGQDGRPESIGASGGLQGYLFLPSETNPEKVVQARLDGFAFSKLKPYETWASFRDEARILWNDYIEAARPINVKRLALRFINRIELPRSSKTYHDFILTVPDVAPGLPNAVSEFFMRLVIPVPDSDATAIVTVATNVPESTESIVPVIFDIDVFFQADHNPQSDAIWKTFEDLRRIKNDIFFKSITAETARLFQ
jgi:uncharacterized protein (TIGR04255 family)